MRLLSFILSKNSQVGEWMELKEQVLDALERNKGHHVSGGALAETLYVSRNAVWKAVKSLQDDGHHISAVTKKGYCLAPDSSILSAASIGKHLVDYADIFDIEVYKSLPSTNTALKEKAAQGAREGTVIAAEEQSAGRGRLGRSFYSPSGSGIYFSILLRPPVKATDATLITTAAAAAVALSIEAITGAQAKIKWVNDVFVDGKKVCGILTEGAFDMESGGVEYVVLGIGINITTPEGGFPPEISGLATSVCGDEAVLGIRGLLIAEILNRFWPYYQNLSRKTYLTVYKEKSLIIGGDIDVIGGDQTRKARALDIDDDCRLVVLFEDGKVESLSTGEVSIRPRTT